MGIRFKLIPFVPKECVLFIASADNIYDERLCDDIPPLKIVGADDHVKRYKKIADRNRSALGFAALQKCLEYFDITPSTARLSVLDGGKPILDNGIEFNISHSDNVAVCVAHRKLTVGVDIERIEYKDPGMETRRKIAKRFFSDNEQRKIEECDSPEVEFTRIWTLREAVGKCFGVGFFQGDIEKYAFKNRFMLRHLYLSSDSEAICENLFDGASYVLTLCVGTENGDRDK